MTQLNGHEQTGGQTAHEPQTEHDKQEAGTVYQLSIGRFHMGFWTSKEEAAQEIKQYYPDAKQFEGMPENPDSPSLPDGQYFIMPRTLYSKDPAKVAVLRQQLTDKLRPE